MGSQGAQAGSYECGESPGGKPSEQLKLVVLWWREECGILGVEVECIDIAKNSTYEGGIPAPY